VEAAPFESLCIRSLRSPTIETKAYAGYQKVLPVIDGESSKYLQHSATYSTQGFQPVFNAMASHILNNKDAIPQWRKRSRRKRRQKKVFNSSKSQKDISCTNGGSSKWTFGYQDNQDDNFETQDDSSTMIQSSTLIDDTVEEFNVESCAVESVYMEVQICFSLKEKTFKENQIGTSRRILSSIVVKKSSLCSLKLNKPRCSCNLAECYKSTLRILLVLHLQLTNPRKELYLFGHFYWSINSKSQLMNY